MKIDPKITIILINKNGKRYVLSTYVSKIKNFANRSLVKKVRLGDFKSIYIKVFYGRDKDGKFINDKTCFNYQELIIAYDAFSDKFLWREKTSDG